MVFERQLHVRSGMGGMRGRGMMLNRIVLRKEGTRILDEKNSNLCRIKCLNKEPCPYKSKDGVCCEKPPIPVQFPEYCLWYKTAVTI